MVLVFLHICRDLLSRDGDPVADSSVKLCHAMLAFLEEHRLEEIGRNHLARHFGVHPNHVSRCFARHGDDSFARTVIRLRMEHARALLRHDDRSVVAIATNCGYVSAEYFVTEFRRFHGCPPGQVTHGGGGGPINKKGPPVGRAFFVGRNDRIRTCDLLRPRQTL